MTEQKGSRWVRRVAFGVGLGLALLLVLAFRIPRGTGTLGADLTVSVGPTGELGVTPAGPILTSNNLKPGNATRGTFAVRNQTGRTLAVSMRVLPSASTLDRAANVQVTAGRTVLYQGSLGGLRSWTTRKLTLASGQPASFSVQVSLPKKTKGGYQGAIVDAPVEFLSRPTGG
jgi:hypothetical protein